MDKTLFDLVVKSHEQKHQYSCSASGHEFIMKLHEKIKPDDFPLQINMFNQGKGFQFEAFLNQNGFSGQDSSSGTEGVWFSPLDATNTIGVEVLKGYFPLVSLPQGSDFHIYVAIPNGFGGFGLFNPAAKSFRTQYDTETIPLLKSATNVNRPNVHLLLYSATGTNAPQPPP